MIDVKAYIWVIKLICAGLAVAGIWYGIHVYDSGQQQIGYDRAVEEYTARKARDDQVALAKDRQLQKEKDDALQKAAAREARLRDDYAAVHATALGLQRTVADLRGHLATDPVEACRSTAAAALAVFGECTAQLGAVAEAADGHASDVETLSDAWPE